MMNIHRFFCTFLALMLFGGNLFSQSGVQISLLPLPQNPAAILEVQSPSQGVLLPRTTMESIVNPTDGLIIYDTMLNHYMYYKETQWSALLVATSFSYFYADSDGDGFGNPYAAIFSIAQPTGYVVAGTDCDDTNPDIYPGAVDVCNEVDDDCDGLIDEDCLSVEYGVLQFPPSITMPPGVTENIYGQVYANGITDPPGQGAGITAQVGYGADNSDPSLGGWTWVAATFNVDVGNNDEYQGTLTVNTSGTYDYAYRFSGDGGFSWIYCDLDGTINGYDIAMAGTLVVE